MKLTELTPEEARVYDTIPKGKASAVKRAELAKRLGLNDREMRQMLEALTEKRHIVCNLMDGRGYYIPASEIEYLEYEKIINSYKCSLQRKEYSIKRAREREYGERSAEHGRIRKRRQKSLQGA